MKSGPNYTLLIAGLALVLPLILLLAVSFGNDPHATPDVMLDLPAPEFSLVDLDGNTVSLSDYEGSAVVINFWSTWCGPCKIEHPVLLRAPERYPGAVFLGIIYQDEAQKAQAYLRTAGSAYPHLIDPSGRISIDYGVTGVPETYFIDANGRIVYKHKGALSVSILDALLGGR